MGYSVHELSELSGVSIRTLRYYEEEGLLNPQRRTNGYRDYGSTDVLRLQQILLFRQAEMPIACIRDLLDAPMNKQIETLQDQLVNLQQQRDRIDTLIGTLETMVRTMQGAEYGAPRDGARMNPKKMDSDRFEAFKQQALLENEQVYGTEVRARYGDQAADASNAKVAALTPGEWSEADSQTQAIAALLARIAAAPNPEELVLGEMGRELHELHRAWLMHYWTPEMYTPAAHRGLANMYVADERFAAYYEAVAPGGAEILRDAIETWA